MIVMTITMKILSKEKIEIKKLLLVDLMIAGAF